MASRINEKQKRPPRRIDQFIKVGILSISLIIASVILKTPANDERASLNPNSVPDIEFIKVPVPREPIASGVKLDSVKFDFVTYPSSKIPEGAITDISLIVTRESAVPLPAKLPIFEQNLKDGNQSGTNPVEERIPPGMRAMTIKVDATIAVEGWAAAGSLVDVLLVQEEKTSVVAEKVKILSAERSTTPYDGEGAPSVPNTVTLLVTQEQCLAINTAIPLGRIAFALRSSRDSDSWSDTIFTASNFNRGASGDKEAAVSGFVRVEGKEGESRSYALSDGKWIVADTKPDGFMVGSSQ